MGWLVNGRRSCVWSSVMVTLLVLVVASCGTAPRGVKSPRASTRAPSTVGNVPADGGCEGRRKLPANGRIAFTANATSDVNSEEVDAPGDIYTVEPDGSSLRRLTTTLDAAEPAWSPDGRQIAFVRIAWRNEYRSKVWLMNADGSGRRRLDGLGDRVHAPAWSPDGTSIAFGRSFIDLGSNDRPIYVMRADGTDQHRVTPDPILAAVPAWR